eukprot:SAG31_NODE_558_length_14153_cov_9.068094_18_plen_90_part_00
MWLLHSLLFQLLYTATFVLLALAHFTEPGILPTEVAMRGADRNQTFVPLNLSYLDLAFWKNELKDRPACYHTVMIDGERRPLREFRAKV